MTPVPAMTPDGVPEGLPPSDGLAPFVAEFRQATDKRPVLRRVIEALRPPGTTAALEIGPGAEPLFTPPPWGWRYVVNDISPDALARLGPGYEPFHADICGDVSAHAGRFDLIFSCHVAEHLDDGLAFYRNQFLLLKPGGRFVRLHPVLFAPPFAANLLLPDRLGRWTVQTLLPHRRAQRSVWPARYRWCTALRREEARRRAVGFRHVACIVGYHHHYVRHVPLLAPLNERLCDAFTAADLRPMAAYCLWLGVK